MLPKSKNQEKTPTSTSHNFMNSRTIGYLDVAATGRSTDTVALRDLGNIFKHAVPEAGAPMMRCWDFGEKAAEDCRSPRRCRAGVSSCHYLQASDGLIFASKNSSEIFCRVLILESASPCTAIIMFIVSKRSEAPSSAGADAGKAEF